MHRHGYGYSKWIVEDGQRPRREGIGVVGRKRERSKGRFPMEADVAGPKHLGCWYVGP